jgi:dihydrofolate reductase
MALTQYFTATSIDGFIADEDNSLEWLFQADAGADREDRFGSFFGAVGAMAMGATTYEWVLEHDQLLGEPAEVAGVLRLHALLGLHSPAAAGR